MSQASVAPSCPDGATLNVGDGLCYAACETGWTAAYPNCVETAPCPTDGNTWTLNGIVGCVPQLQARAQSAPSVAGHGDTCPFGTSYNTADGYCYSNCTAPNANAVSATQCGPLCPTGFVQINNGAECAFVVTTLSGEDSACPTGYYANPSGADCCPNTWTFSDDGTTCFPPGTGSGTGSGMGSGTGSGTAAAAAAPSYFLWLLLLFIAICVTVYLARQAKLQADAIVACDGARPGTLAACVSSQMGGTGTVGVVHATAATAIRGRTRYRV